MQYRRFRPGLTAALAVCALSSFSVNSNAAEPETALVDGLWCGTGLLRGSSMRLAQKDQAFDGTLFHRGKERPLQGRIEGVMLRAESKRYGELAFSLEGNDIRLAQAEGWLAIARGTTFHRAAGGSCSAPASPTAPS